MGEVIEHRFDTIQVPDVLAGMDRVRTPLAEVLGRGIADGLMDEVPVTIDIIIDLDDTPQAIAAAGGLSPVSSNGTESYATPRHHSSSSLRSSGLRRGRSSPRAIASDSAKEYCP